MNFEVRGVIWRLQNSLSCPWAKFMIPSWRLFWRIFGHFLHEENFFPENLLEPMKLTLISLVMSSDTTRHPWRRFFMSYCLIRQTSFEAIILHLSYNILVISLIILLIARRVSPAVTRLTVYRRRQVWTVWQYGLYALYGLNWQYGL